MFSMSMILLGCYNISIVEAVPGGQPENNYQNVYKQFR